MVNNFESSEDTLSKYIEQKFTIKILTVYKSRNRNIFFRATSCLGVLWLVVCDTFLLLKVKCTPCIAYYITVTCTLQHFRSKIWMFCFAVSKQQNTQTNSVYFVPMCVCWIITGCLCETFLLHSMKNCSVNFKGTIDN